MSSYKFINLKLTGRTCVRTNRHVRVCIPSGYGLYSDERTTLCRHPLKNCLTSTHSYVRAQGQKENKREGKEMCRKMEDLTQIFQNSHSIYGSLALSLFSSCWQGRFHYTPYVRVYGVWIKAKKSSESELL